MTKFLLKKDFKILRKGLKMLTKELTDEQKQVPDLTEKQLYELGFAVGTEKSLEQANHEWKLNAKMLGFDAQTNGNVDDFIEEINNTKIKTFLKGEQLICFSSQLLEGLDFPIAFEGDEIVSEQWEFENGEWQNMHNFLLKDRLICCYTVPHGLTGRFKLIYGKYVASTNQKTTTTEGDWTASMENTNKQATTNNLKERNIEMQDTKNREMQFVEQNFQPAQRLREEPMYRIVRS